MEELQRVLHEFRQELDRVTRNVKTLKDNPVAMVCIREIALSVTKLEEAKMWLGKALGETGSELPAQFADKAEGATLPPGQNVTSAPTQPETPATPATPPTGEQQTPPADTVAQPAATDTTPQQ